MSEDKTEKKSWFARLRSGLSKSSGKLGEGIAAIFTKRKLDDAMLAQLEEVLLATDMGPVVAAELTETLARQRHDKDVTTEEVKQVLAEEVSRLLSPYTRPLVIDKSRSPHVVLMVGVNGNGKTTTIGKLAEQWRREGYRVMLAAADTFRAAAVEQLEVWGRRSGVPVITGAPQADPASVAFQALEKARQEKIDVLVVDTAGRLQNKNNLMEELQKIIRVIQKLDPAAPHDVVQVLDATTGQNALSQVEVFRQMVKVTGLIVTKLDGTAKGGVVLALAKKFALPLYAIGIGEGIDDLRAFSARDFADNLLALDKIADAA
jgi:fused signal recognition particle receptor